MQTLAKLFLRSSDLVCASCQTYSQRPRCFKFTLGEDTLREDKDLNHTVYTEVSYIEGRLILKVDDEATNYQAAKRPRIAFTQSLWRVLQLSWINVYLCALDFITHDAGNNFMSESFTSNADLLHIIMKLIAVESANSMTVVERYHQ